MRLLCLVFLFLVAYPAAAAELWRWVDERGVVHYSDRPVPGAEKVEIAGAQTYSAPPAPAFSPDEGGDADDGTDADVYRRLSITRPNPGETLWNIEGRLNVAIEADPVIRGRHSLQVFLDGQQVDNAPPAGGAFTLGNVFRGEHSLRASIVDEQGRILISSEPVTFFVQQTSLNNPNNPNNPPPRPTPTPRTPPARPGGG